jgi:polysaccharide pyruvyl transferase WcaK-like protein
MSKRILVEPGSYSCFNMGDVSMMQVALNRLTELWPGAEIEVVTLRPNLLSRYFPSATPLSAEERDAWLRGRSLLGRLHRYLPAWLSGPLRRLEWLLWLRLPWIVDIGISLKAAIMRRKAPSSSNFRKHLTEADLIVVSGMGMLNDAFEDSATDLLDELEAGLQDGKPVVFFGQGVGPITNTELLARARTVLPRVGLISLREARTGLPLLLSLGVPRDRIYVTGDDAIELAYMYRPASLGDAIGINLRIADYAGMGEEVLDKLRAPCQCAARQLKSTLLPVPILLHEADSDVVLVDRILNDQGSVPQETIESPEDVIRRIGKCRVVVTGSYHGGVLALAQGIPVVGLLQSAYYEQKFSGLMEQFPGGCTVLDFRRPLTSDEIREAICGAWKSAEQVRESLLEAAAVQVQLSRAAYQLAHKLFPLADE